MYLNVDFRNDLYECNVHCIILFVCVLDKDSQGIEMLHAFDVHVFLHDTTNDFHNENYTVNNIDGCRKAVRSL